MSILNIASRIEGWLYDDQVELLYRLAGQAEKPIVELGSYHGKSTVTLALGSRDGSGQPVYAIDPHEPSADYPDMSRAAFMHSLLTAGVADRVRLVNLPSKAAARAWEYQADSIGLLLIDADHRYEAVAADYANWNWFIKPGGFLAFHDVDRPGVRQVVEERVDQRWQRQPDVENMAWFIRKSAS